MRLQEIEESLDAWEDRAIHFNTKRRDALEDVGIAQSYQLSCQYGMFSFLRGCYDYVSFDGDMLSFVDSDSDGDNSYMSIPYSVLDGDENEDEWIARWVEEVKRKRDEVARIGAERDKESRRLAYERLRKEFGDG